MGLGQLKKFHTMKELSLDNPLGLCYTIRMNNTTQNTEYMTVANTILAQLGGNRFRAMTGASNLVGSPDGRGQLSFRLPGKGFARNGINLVIITLETSDTYTVEFKRIWGTKIKKVNKYEDVYCDMLREIFEEETGLRTSL
jgi:hypothetical protein